ncbi:hypothetical protein ACW5XF_07045 [Aeromonas lusitana]|uniref:Uncharacterized protein n=1 Tax=Aeromonas lusitana TaxID=931529 RepID=A0A2M8H674_9GAMM|nr:hypothetical protein [Aeromonas lusitana]PJC92055.1 hypothetical protein CUC44_16770 [Aeromonas lusitana]
MLGFVLGDMYCRLGSYRPPPRLGKHFPIALEYQLRGRVSAAVMTIETLLDTPYPQKKFRDLVYGAFIDRQRRLFAEHVIIAQLESSQDVELSVDLSFISTAVPIGLLAISEEIALLTAPRPTKTHPHHDVLCQVLDCTAMLMFYAKVIRQRNAVLENIGYQFGYQPATELSARVGTGGDDDYEAFMVNVMTCLAHSHSLKEALENGVKMGIREPAFFCIVGAVASTLWGIPKPWAYQISQFIQRHNAHYIQILLRCEARVGRAQINLVPPKPPLCAPVKRQVIRFLRGAF